MFFLCRSLLSLWVSNSKYLKIRLESSGATLRCLR